MNRTAPILLVKRAFALAVAYYAIHITAFHSFNGPTGNSAFKLFAGWESVPPEPVFSGALFIGALLQWYGASAQSPKTCIWGLTLTFTVFFAAFVSCCMTQPSSTGVPAYLILSIIPAMIAYCEAVTPQTRPQ